MVHSISHNQTQLHTQTDPSNLFPELRNIQTDIFFVEIIHHHPIPHQHGKTSGHGTSNAAVLHAQGNSQHQIQHPGKEINLRPEVISVHGLENGQADVLDQVDGKRQNDQDGDPIGIFKTGSRPQLDKLPAENHKAGGHQRQLSRPGSI